MPRIRAWYTDDSGRRRPITEPIRRYRSAASKRVFSTRHEFDGKYGSPVQVKPPTVIEVHRKAYWYYDVGLGMTPEEAKVHAAEIEGWLERQGIDTVVITVHEKLYPNDPDKPEVYYLIYAEAEVVFDRPRGKYPPEAD